MNELPQPTVLVVDDDPNSLQLLGSLLRSQEFDVVYADNGKEALKVAEAAAPDVIILDIMMPEMDGYEVCCRLRENKKTADIPVIFLTAKTQPEDVVSGFFAGGADYLVKPFNPVELLVRVETQIELRRSQRQLRNLNDYLSELTRHQKRFFSIMAHDLRNQISGCLSLMDLLVEESGAFQKEELLDNSRTIQRELGKTYEFLDNLLHWGRMQMDHLTLQSSPADLAGCAGEALKLTAAAAKKKSIAIRNEIPAGQKIFGDADAVITVLRNFIGNALKFTPAGGAVTLHAEESDGEVKTTVRDTGVGMSPDFTENLFHIKKKTTTPGTENEAGSGFGLILCKALVEKQNGRIEVESAPGKGSAFSFILPGAD